MTVPSGARTSKEGYVSSVLVLGMIAAGLFAAFLAPPVQSQSTVNVTIDNFAFTPNAITVVIGVNNTVTWTNLQTGSYGSQGVTHSVTANDNSWGSTVLPGASYTYTFAVAGTYGYHCKFHSYMTGTVVVVGAGGTTSTSSTSSTLSSTTQTTPATTTTPSTTSTTSPTTSTASSMTPTTQSTITTTPTTAASSSSTSAGIPEFPYGALAVAAVTILVLTSYVMSRRYLLPRESAPS